MQFNKIILSSDFVSECVACADVNRDGHMDIVAGPWWYEGPDFKKRHRIFSPGRYDPHGYSPATQPCFVYDFNGDGWLDVFYVMRTPGKNGNYGFYGWGEQAGWTGVWFENPGDSGGEWKAHQVLGNIANEAIVWEDINRDGRPEIVYNSREYYGYAAFDPDRPEAPWTFHPISDSAACTLGQGIGAGDITGNGRMDILSANGWWEQPEHIESREPWTFRPWPFAENAANMIVYDVDGDGLNDIITVWHAHKYGLVWHKQRRSPEGEIEWERREILPVEPDFDSGALRISQLHALALADMNGNGLMDIVAGKRWWAHGPAGDPESDAPAHLYCFELSRDKGDARFTPHLIDSDCGAGTQIATADLNGNGHTDIIISSKKGVSLLFQDTVGQKKENLK